MLDRFNRKCILYYEIHPTLYEPCCQIRTVELGRFWLRSMTIKIKPHLSWRSIAQTLLNPILVHFNMSPILNTHSQYESLISKVDSATSLLLRIQRWFFVSSLSSIFNTPYYYWPIAFSIKKFGGDLKHMLAFDSTASFFQVKSILVRLRRELQHIKFLTPVELEHAIITSEQASKESVFYLLKSDATP